MKNLDVFQKQKALALKGMSKDLNYRKLALVKLRELLKTHEEKLWAAIEKDIKKSRFEAYVTELALIYSEIDEALKNLDKWSRPKKVKSGIANFPAKAFIVPEPFGVTLIIGAWNYPYQLTLAPMVAAIAAGNTCIVKPSELPQETSKIMAQIINQNFDPAFLHVAEGGVDVTQELLTFKFDKIFFTGSTTVGKIVAKAAAENLTPLTLELGGKSPCLVFADADLKMTAKRILWGKFLNAGQTCIAPDYLLVEKSIYQNFLEELKIQLPSIVGTDPKTSESYVRIINQKNFERLEKLIVPSKVYVGGAVSKDDRYIEPTILKDITFSDEIMSDEIFGPILPVISFTSLDETITEIKTKPKPLSLYVFSKDKNIQNKIISEISFGGGCINDTVMHVSVKDLPFGGVGQSGMGSYHGEFGFKTFSHYKSILKKGFLWEAPLKYAPYTESKFKMIRRLFG